MGPENSFKNMPKSEPAKKGSETEKAEEKKKEITREQVDKMTAKPEGKKENMMDKKVEKCLALIMKKVEELNKDLAEVGIRIPLVLTDRLENMGWEMVNKDIDYIANEAIARELEGAIKDISMKKEGFPAGIKTGFNEIIDIRNKQIRGEKLEPTVDPEEADKKIEKLQEALKKIRDKIGW